MVVYLKRSGGQEQYSEPLQFQTNASDRFAELVAWMTNNPTEEMSVETLARRASLSPRQFFRRFKEHFGSSPATFVETLRLNEARRRLSGGESSIEHVAESVGFNGADSFRRAFERRFRVTPSKYRRSFGLPSERRPNKSSKRVQAATGRSQQMNNKILNFFDHLRQDLAYGLRGLGRNPGFAAVVILTLALGIGANTAIFSVVHGVLMRPLPYHAPERLVLLHQAAPKIGEDSFGFSVLDFTDFRERTRAFSALSEYHSMWFILLGRPEPERVQTGVVSDNFFDLLGVKPLLGRTFQPGEDKQGAAPVLVLSYNFWQKSFAGDPNVVGQVFQMNDKPHTVVGVLPPLPAFPNLDQVFMPAAACPFRGRDSVLTNRDGRIISHVFARLKDGVTPAQALDDVQRIGSELAKEYPQNYPIAEGYTVRMREHRGGVHRQIAHTTLCVARDLRLRAADRVRECRESLALAPGLARSRARHARGSGRGPRTNSPAADHGEFAARHAWRSRRSGARHLGIRCAHAPMRPRFSRGRTRSESARRCCFSRRRFRC